MESEIGICSLMRERFETILAANEESRITVMTHSVSVMHEMEHILSDLKKTFKASGNKKLDYAIYRLAENSTETYEMRKTEYQNLLKLAYDFASSDVEDIEETYVIGNVLRRIVEGYSTFNYGVSMEMLARDPDLVKRLGPASEMLSAVMYRLALNDESHLKDRIASLNPMVGFGQYSYDEKRIVARCVLVMLFRFDQEHVIKHLLRGGVSSGEVKKSIEEWENTFMLSK
nr:AAA family ATPase [Collinsella intestinalis]